MTVAQLVAREQARLRLAIAARGVALALAVAAAVVAMSALALGEARWITRPSAPALAWLAAAVLVAAAFARTLRDLRRGAAATRIAAAIEREHALRAGSLRGALEVAGSGVLGRRAADQVAARLTGLGRVLAPGLQRGAWRRGAAAPPPRR